jgi:N-acetylglutamate synthase-like GNAT family acetyltransferase
MEVRLAVMDEAEKISEIAKALEIADYGYSDLKHIRDFISRGRYYVVVDNGEIVGIMSLKRVEGSIQIFSIASRKKGAGKTMVEFAVRKCREEGVPKLWCWSMKAYDVKGFYEKMGFEEQYLMRKQWLGGDCYFFGKVIG